MHIHGIPARVVSKVTEFEVERLKRDMMHKEDILATLPEFMRMELQELLFKGLVETVPFFQDIHRNMRMQVVSMLVPKYIAKEEVLVQ